MCIMAVYASGSPGSPPANKMLIPAALAAFSLGTKLVASTAITNMNFAPMVA